MKKNVDCIFALLHILSFVLMQSVKHCINVVNKRTVFNFNSVFSFKVPNWSEVGNHRIFASLLFWTVTLRPVMFVLDRTSLTTNIHKETHRPVDE